MSARPWSRLMGVGALALLLTLLAAPLALAVSADEVAAEVEAEGFYIEPGGEDVDTEALRDGLDQVSTRVLPVLLADEPPGGEQAFAEDVLANLQEDGTVLVISPSAVQVVSSEADDGQVDEALSLADDEVRFDTAGAGEIATAFAAAFDEVVRESGGATTSDDGGGLRTGALLLAVGLGVVGVVTFAGWRWRERRRREQSERLLTEAREEVRGQISALAEQILQLSDRVELAGNAEASGLFSDATAAYGQAQQELERVKAPQELERISDELDHARWQLEAVAASLDGREPPPRPEREPACFFDPTHGAGTEEAVIDTPAGQKPVQVCKACAAKLEAGEAPEPRMIAVGGQQVPAPMAPRYFGGGGLGWLGDFAMILGGHRHSYGWGGYSGWGGYRPPRRSRSWAGSFGGLAAGLGGRRRGGGFRASGSGRRSRGVRGGGRRRR
jgi:hypothetical protein